jgi:hypothetical protein
MKGSAVLFALIVSTLALMSCATTQEGPDIVGQAPPQTTSRADLSKMCRPGFYFCPGEVMGCCPNGWGCSSTHCIRPKPHTAGTQPAGSEPTGKQPTGKSVDKQVVDEQAVDKRHTGRRPVDGRCAPGFYFCPGEVMGCCPNGWGCASTHCIRPPPRRDL